MARQLVWLLMTCLVLVPLRSLPAQSPAEQEIDRLTEQLASDRFHVREAASKKLVEIGEPTLSALHQAKNSDDPEVRLRAEQIFAAIEDKLYRLELLLTGHTDAVWGVCVSADGKRVLTSSSDKTLRLWDTDTGKCLRVFEGHTARVAFGAALSPDGKRVLSGSDDKTVRLWDADTGKELLQMTGHTANVDGVAFGPRGMAISTSDRTMHLWDLKTGKQAGVFTGHTGVISNVAYWDEARLAATCGHNEDPSIRLWDLGSGKELRKLTGPSPPICSVCFSPDGKRLLSSAPNDNTVRVWDVESGRELKQIAAADPYNAAFSPSGKRIVSGGLHDNTVRVWDAASGKELRNYEGHTGSVTGVAFFPDGQRIASASFDGTVRIWRAPR